MPVQVRFNIFLHCDIYTVEATYQLKSRPVPSPLPRLFCISTTRCSLQQTETLPQDYNLDCPPPWQLRYPSLLPLHLSGHRVLVLPGTKIRLPNQRQRLQPRRKCTILLSNAPSLGFSMGMRRRRGNTSHVAEAWKAFETRVRRPAECPL